MSRSLALANAAAWPRRATGASGSGIQDGVPLGLGQQGPLWLLKSGTLEPNAEDPKHGDWVWNVFYIRIGE